MAEEEFLSCQDIQNSVFLAPSSLRVCCKRFFVNGKRKGDVELLTIKDPTNDLSLKNIYEAKLRLIGEINSGAKTYARAVLSCSKQHGDCQKLCRLIFHWSITRFVI